MDLDSGRLGSQLSGHTAVVRTVSYSADGSLLASGSSDGTIRLWSTIDYKCLEIIPAHTSDVMSISFGRDGAVLASASLDRTIKIWRIMI